MNRSSKNINKAQILKLVCVGSDVTRTLLTQKTGLSKMSVSNLVNELGQDHYIIETENNSNGANGAASQGRPPFAIDISPRAPLAVAVYLSRDSCQMALCNLKAQVVKYSSFEMAKIDSAEKLFATLQRHYKTLIDGLDIALLGVGISSIGPIDKVKGVILNPPDFHGLCNIAIQPFFEKLTGLPVYFDNDMSGAALAEAMFGHGREIANFVYLGVTRGVGAAIISNGNLINGSTGINGEVGHTSIKFDGPLCFCKNRGCLELYTSIPVIVKKAQVMMAEAGILPRSEELTWIDFVEYAKSKEYYTLKVLDEFCEYLSVAIINLINLFDCDEVFLGHEIALVFDLIESRLTELTRNQNFSCALRDIRVRRSAFGENAALTGSACLAFNELFRGGLF